MAFQPTPPFVPNDPMSLAKNLRPVGADGNQVTVQLPRDYINNIGGNLSAQIDNYNQILGVLNNQDSEITTLQTQVNQLLSSGIDFLPNIPAGCLSSGATLPLPTVTSLLVTNSCGYNSVLGTTSALSAAVGAQCANLNTSPQLGLPSAQMAAIPGWKASPVTVADGVNNLWLALCDARAGIQLILNTITPSCTQVVVAFASAIPNYNTGINIYFSGYSFIPSGYTDTGSSIVVTDTAGNVVTTSLNIITASTSVNPINIPISGTSLLPNSNYTITVKSKVNNATWNITCNKTVIQTLVNNISTCPILILTPGKNTVNFSAQFLINNSVTYAINLLSSGTIISTQTFINPAANATGVFNNLSSGSTYSLQAITTISGGSPVTCTPYPFNTTS